MPPGLFASAADCLSANDPGAKCAGVKHLLQQVQREGFTRDSDSPIPDILQPGRPGLPELVEPGQVPRRRLGSAPGRIALLHAIAHIEFNAINLALDALCRFRDMPDEYYLDWLSVAADEARHYQMLEQRLSQLGAAYGDFPAHNGLWEMAQSTATSCLARMALVPRVLEARGLDVTPGMIQRLRQVGDEDSVAVLEVILAEEVRHVAIGTRWFTECCKREGRDPDSTFLQLLKTHYNGRLRGPFNTAARLQAGFTETELSALEADA